MGLFGVFDRLRGKSQEPSDFQKAMIHSIVTADTQKTQAEHEEAQQLAINLPMLRDDYLLKTLESMAIVKYYSQADKEKKNPLAHINWDLLALRAKASPLIRTSYVDPIDTLIAQVESEIFVLRIEMNLNEDEYELGGTNFLEAMGDIFMTAWSDAKEGRKAKLLKVAPREYQISIPEPQKKGFLK